MHTHSGLVDLGRLPDERVDAIEAPVDVVHGDGANDVEAVHLAELAQQVVVHGDLLAEGLLQVGARARRAARRAQLYVRYNNYSSGIFRGSGFGQNRIGKYPLPLFNYDFHSTMPVSASVGITRCIANCIRTSETEHE